MSNNDSNLTMATFNLPFDVTIDILSRLPVKPLCRFTSVCKSWYALIKTPNFISKHLTHFTLNPNFPFTSLLVSTKSKGYGMSLFFNDEFDRHIDLDFSFLTQESDPDIFRRIPGYKWWDERGAKLKRVTFGFGFHPSAKDFKLVWIAYYSCFDGRVVVRAEVFSVRNDNWREIDAGMARFFDEEIGAVMPYEMCGSSWTKQFKVGPFPGIGSTVGGEENVEIMLVGCARDGKLIVEDRSESDVLKLFLYDPKSQVTKNLPAAHMVYPYEVYLYKESLLPVGNIEAVAGTHV
ncbi:hypothetical protein ACSBR2_003270 [Camellia fascicularis]